MPSIARRATEGYAAMNWRKNMFYTYILRSIDHPNQRYIGCTADLKARLAKHNAGEVPHTSNFKQSYKFPDKSSQIVISVDLGCRNYVKNPHPAVVNACRR